MISALLPFFQWCDATWLSREIRASTWQFAILEMVHLLGLTVLLGSLWVIDMRLFGLGMKRQKTGDLAKNLNAWIWAGLLVMVSSGVLLFFGEPMKLFGSPSFFVKMTLLALALLLQFTLFRSVTSDQHVPSALDKVVGSLSLVLWFGVGLAGRGIGFL